MRHQSQFHRSFLSMVSTLIVVALCPGLWAAITPIGSISPAYDSTDPWSIEGNLTVGLEDDGAVSVSSRPMCRSAVMPIWHGWTMSWGA